MQHKPRFSGILVVAVLMVLILFFVSLSPLLSASAANHINYSEIYYYFENQQVTSYRLDMGTNKLEMWLKEGKIALPDTTVQSEDQQKQTGITEGIVSGGVEAGDVFDEEAEQQNSSPTAQFGAPGHAVQRFGLDVKTV